jgi:dienelactone hydrolase
LSKRPEVDINRIALWGVSKGAEFTALAASKYDWIDAAVACVPSDAVWEGYGREPKPGEAISSWSWQGQALPYIKLFPYIEVNSPYKTNTVRYEKSRAVMPNVESTLIPIENSKARLLLISVDRDEVWASGAMTRNIEQRMQKYGKQKLVESIVYPTAGHMICGDGAFSARLYSKQSDDPELKDITAEGEAQVDSWKKTLEFLRKHLQF